MSEVRGQWQHRLHQLRHTRGLTVGISNSGRVPYRDTSHRPLSAVISTTTHWLPSSTNSVRRPVGGVQPEMGGMYVARRTMTSVPSNSGESGTAPSGSDPPVKKTELKKKKTATTEAGGADAGTASAKRQDASTTPKPSTSTKVALFAKKLAVEYPKLLVTKTYEFFRLMIMGACDWAGNVNLSSSIHPRLSPSRDCTQSPRYSKRRQLYCGNIPKMN